MLGIMRPQPHLFLSQLFRSGLVRVNSGTEAGLGRISSFAEGFDFPRVDVGVLGCELVEGRCTGSTLFAGAALIHFLSSLDERMLS